MLGKGAISLNFRLKWPFWAKSGLNWQNAGKLHLEANWFLIIALIWFILIKKSLFFTNRLISGLNFRILLLKSRRSMAYTWSSKAHSWRIFKLFLHFRYLWSKRRKSVIFGWAPMLQTRFTSLAWSNDVLKNQSFFHLFSIFRPYSDIVLYCAALIYQNHPKCYLFA